MSELEYNLEAHIEMLKLMLKTDKPCHDDNCPLVLFREKHGLDIDLHIRGNFSCGFNTEIGDICNGFIDIDPEFAKEPCPCRELGEQEALRRTIIKLEEMGHL